MRSWPFDSLRSLRAPSKVEGLLTAAAALGCLAPGWGCRGEGHHHKEVRTMCEPIERTGVVTMRGKPLTLVGPELQVGQAAPTFEAVDGDYRTVKSSDFAGKVLLITSVPSLDTGVCALETKRFNEEAAKLPKDVVVLTISQDLPFAQSRFCAAEKIGSLQVLSDHVWRSFGLNWGVFIKENGLLARAVWVVGRDGRIAYAQVVADLSQFPDFDAALAAARRAAEAK